MGPEAVNYLSPAYPATGSTDQAKFLDLPKILEAATGGEYKWSTATEMRARRSRLATGREGAAPPCAGGQRCQSEVGSRSSMPASARDVAPAHSAAAASGVFDQAIDFEHTNLNVCWLQQLDIFQDFWVHAEARRHLGFVGRFVLSFAMECTVPPGCRRAGGELLASVMAPAWEQVLRSWGPRVAPAPPAAQFGVAAARAWDERFYQDVASLRARRREFGYGVRTVMGKWEYMCASVAFLNHILEPGVGQHPRACISDNALKCALRFLDRRMALGAHVLDSETQHLPAQQRGASAQLRASCASLGEADAAVAEMLRAVTAHLITHHELQKKMALYRRRGQETLADLHARRNIVLEHAAQLGLGELRQTTRQPALRKAPLTSEVRTTLQRLGVATTDWPVADTLGETEPRETLAGQSSTPTVVARSAGEQRPSNRSGQSAPGCPCPRMCGGAKGKGGPKKQQPAPVPASALRRSGDVARRPLAAVQQYLDAGYRDESIIDALVAADADAEARGAGASSSGGSAGVGASSAGCRFAKGDATAEAPSRAVASARPARPLARPAAARDLAAPVLKKPARVAGGRCQTDLSLSLSRVCVW